MFHSVNYGGSCGKGLGCSGFSKDFQNIAKTISSSREGVKQLNVSRCVCLLTLYALARLLNASANVGLMLMAALPHGMMQQHK